MRIDTCYKLDNDTTPVTAQTASPAFATDATVSGVVETANSLSNERFDYLSNMQQKYFVLKIQK
jgi:hypothetical protein